MNPALKKYLQGRSYYEPTKGVPGYYDYILNDTVYNKGSEWAEKFPTVYVIVADKMGIVDADKLDACTAAARVAGYSVLILFGESGFLTLHGSKYLDATKNPVYKYKLGRQYWFRSFNGYNR